jgi:hypothetical protein
VESTGKPGKKSVSRYPAEPRETVAYRTEWLGFEQQLMGQILGGPG